MRTSHLNCDIPLNRLIIIHAKPLNITIVFCDIKYEFYYRFVLFSLNNTKKKTTLVVKYE